MSDKLTSLDTWKAFERDVMIEGGAGSRAVPVLLATEDGGCGKGVYRYSDGLQVWMGGDVRIWIGLDIKSRSLSRGPIFYAMITGPIGDEMIDDYKRKGGR